MPVGFQVDSGHLVTQSWPASVYQEWDLESGELLRAWSFAGAPRFPFGYSSVAGRNWFIRLADDGSGQLLNLPTSRETVLDLDIKQVTAAALSPDGNQLAVVGRYGTGGLWDIPTGIQRTTYSGVLQAMTAVSFSPDGKRLAIGSDGAEAIKLWDLASDLELLTLTGEGSWFGPIAFSAADTLLAASNREGRVHFWRAPTWAEIHAAEAAGR
jgi:WD40 repeat protein